eukprot:GEZU01001099.1.p1 GENE.GEZU01001099.1~~GEZU01001099.1.p1  ORF type:complete len:900 (-),score=305.42 GEZU01001099.1:245-2944(-)
MHSESLYEDEQFPARDLAALVASKVYYHLGDLKTSLSLALGAGNLFNVNDKSEYIETITSQCIDEYIQSRQDEQQAAKIDKRLEAVVERMFDRCFADGEFKQALGIALESRRLDKLEQAIRDSTRVHGDRTHMINHCFDVAMNIVQSRDFRQKVLRTLVKLYQTAETPDYFGVINCLTFLEDPNEVANVLNKLLSSDDKEQHLIAYQVGFDLCDTAPQHFLRALSDLLPKGVDGDADKAKDANNNNEGTFEGRMNKLRTILSGSVSIGLHLEFLFRHNHTDMLLLKNIKSSVEPRNSVYHSATVITNAFMHAGTTIDTFLRENLDWLARATNWAKFSATASLGVIHKGQIKESLSVLQPYLPSGVQSASPYSEGGALYAIGIIHSNHGDEMTKYLSDALKNAGSNEVVQHGASLGLGLAAMATENDELYEDLKNLLYMDSAVAGEAAGVGIGLVMAGSASEKAIEEMLAYAHETQHEKIIRGLAMGIAMTMYGREEEADTLIEQLLRDKDAILRYGAMYTIGLAYCGTSNNSAIRRLLHFAVSDVSDDVRRAAVLNLGFVLFKTPEQCPRLVSLLAESYNPHVRYGATLAVGISCAGTGMKEAIDLLEPLTKDPIDFVRQGALIGLAMVLIQQTEAQEPKVATIRKLFQSTIADRHEEVMTKFGAILASGIIDAGGRNVTISLQRGGQNNMRAIIGIAMFTQYWFWFPFIHFLSLAFAPTAVIGLNADLKMPKFSFKSNAPPSMFAYPPPTAPPEKAVVARLPQVVLSTTAKAKARAAQKRKEETSAMEIEKPEEKKEEGGEKKEEAGAGEKKEEATFEILQNPARVTRAQANILSFDVDERYTPLKKDNISGIVLLRDNKPGEEEVLVEPKVLKKEGAAGAAGAEEEEPQPPEPFEWP